jgi:hypothetical protein
LLHYFANYLGACSIRESRKLFEVFRGSMLRVAALARRSDEERSFGRRGQVNQFS